MVKTHMIKGSDSFFCGAGHEMVTVDVDGEVYPCHRFLPWVTGKPAPKGQTNFQSQYTGSRLNIGHFCHLLSNVDRLSENRNGQAKIEKISHFALLFGKNCISSSRFGTKAGTLSHLENRKIILGQPVETRPPEYGTNGLKKNIKGD
jgi:radical SAM protein with 4Fe4S-binding SPASM domain